MHAPACKNRMTIIGPDEEIERFKTEVASENSVLSLTKALPVPEELLEPNANNITPAFLEKYGAIDPMTWKDDNWGVYTDFEDTELVADMQYAKDGEPVPELVAKYGTRILVYTYTTSCIPPLPSYREFSLKFPELTFHMSFDVEVEHTHSTCGFLLVKAGKMLKKWFNPMSFRTFKAQMDDIESPISKLIAIEENENLDNNYEEGEDE